MSALEFHPEFIAQSAPDKPAFVMLEDGAAVTYGELVERAARAANLFASLGINQGDTIAFLLENHIRYPELLWAAKNSGLRYVAVSTHLNATDAAYIVQDCGARLLVSSAAMRGVALEAVQALAAAPVLLMLDDAVAPFLPYEELVAAQPATRLQNRRRGASMLYSSGTTGRPKGIRTEIPDLPPEIPPQRFAMVQKQYGFDAATVFINPGPFYHAGPLRFMMMVQRAGGTVIGARRFDAQAVLDAIGQYGGTHGFFSGSPSLRIPNRLTRRPCPPCAPPRAMAGLFWTVRNPRSATATLRTR